MTITSKSSWYTMTESLNDKTGVINRTCMVNHTQNSYTCKFTDQEHKNSNSGGKYWCADKHDENDRQLKALSIPCYLSGTLLVAVIAAASTFQSFITTPIKTVGSLRLHYLYLKVPWSSLGDVYGGSRCIHMLYLVTLCFLRKYGP